MKLKFDLDPSLRKVVAIGILIFMESLLGGLLILSQEGTLPSLVQWITILTVAGLALVTYFLTFLRSESE